MGPAVSVLLPFRDAAATLGACLDSIQAQSLGAFEVLAVDDHSTDGSTELAAARAAADPRIRLLTNPKRGLVSALNFGLSEASSELVARMDADDLMHPERLRLQHAYLTRHLAICLLGSRVRLFPEGRIQAGYREYIRWQNGLLTPAEIADELFVESPFAHPSVMFRRSRVLRLGGYRDGPFPEDYDLWLRLHAAEAPMAKLPEVLLDWREGEGRASRVDPRYAREAFDRLRADHLARELRRRGRAEDFVIWGAGRKTRRRCRPLLALGLHPRAWIDIDPRKIGNRLDGVPVVGQEWLAQQPRPFVLVYVASHGAREDIAERLAPLGYRRGHDFLNVG